MKINKKTLITKISKIINNHYFAFPMAYIMTGIIIFNTQMDFVDGIGYRKIGYLYILSYILYVLFYFFINVTDILINKVYTNLLVFIIIFLCYSGLFFLILRKYTIIF